MWEDEVWKTVAFRGESDIIKTYNRLFNIEIKW